MIYMGQFNGAPQINGEKVKIRREYETAVLPDVTLSPFIILHNCYEPCISALELFCLHA